MEQGTERWLQTTTGAGVMVPTPAAIDAARARADQARTAIERALADGPPLRHGDLVALGAELRGHIGYLLPIAEKSIDSLWHGSREWHSRKTVLDAVPRLLAEDMGAGLASATQHVQQLARTCRTLLDYAGPIPR